MQNGWALQSGTSHFLGQNFAKAFDVTFSDDANQQLHFTRYGTMLLAPRWRRAAVSGLHFRRLGRGSKAGPTRGGAAAASCWCRWMREPLVHDKSRRQPRQEDKKRLAVPQVRGHGCTTTTNCPAGETPRREMVQKRWPNPRRHKAGGPDPPSIQAIAIQVRSGAHPAAHPHHPYRSQSASALRLALLCRGRRARPPSVRRRPQRTQRLLHHTRRRLEHLPHTRDIQIDDPTANCAERAR